MNSKGSVSTAMELTMELELMKEQRIIKRSNTVSPFSIGSSGCLPFKPFCLFENNIFFL